MLNHVYNSYHKDFVFWIVLIIQLIALDHILQLEGRLLPPKYRFISCMATVFNSGGRRGVRGERSISYLRAGRPGVHFRQNFSALHHMRHHLKGVHDGRCFPDGHVVEASKWPIMCLEIQGRMRGA